MKIVRCTCGWSFDYEHRPYCPGCGKDGQDLPVADIQATLVHDCDSQRISRLMLIIKGATAEQLPLSVKVGNDTFTVRRDTRDAFTLGMLCALEGAAVEYEHKQAN